MSFGTGTLCRGRNEIQAHIYLYNLQFGHFHRQEKITDQEKVGESWKRHEYHRYADNNGEEDSTAGVSFLFHNRSLRLHEMVAMGRLPVIAFVVALPFAAFGVRIGTVPRRHTPKLFLVH